MVHFFRTGREACERSGHRKRAVAVDRCLHAIDKLLSISRIRHQLLMEPLRIEVLKLVSRGERPQAINRGIEQRVLGVVLEELPPLSGGYISIANGVKIIGGSVAQEF